MKTRDWGYIVLYFFLLSFALFFALRARKMEREIDALLRNTKTDTVILFKTDTVTIIEPREVVRYVSRKEVIEVSDTLVVHDTIREVLTLPREFIRYEDSTYMAVVSGFQPRLDTLQIYSSEKEITLTKIVKVPPRRWGIGVGAAIAPKKPYIYIGVGVFYDILPRK